MSVNPFRYGQLVFQDEYCPRPALEKRLIERIKSGQNTVIQGERRVGKTSLIYRAISRLRGKRLFYIDLWGVKTGGDVLKRALHGLSSVEKSGTLIEKIMRFLPNISVAVSADPLSGLPTLSPSVTSRDFRPQDLGGLFELIEDLHRKRPLILAFDEFQDVLKLPEADVLLAFLRSKIQFLGDIPFLFAGSVRNEMWQIFASPDSPFFTSAEFLEVSATDFDDFPGFIRKRFASGKIDISDELMNIILDWCDHVPGDIQQLCSALWDTMNSRRKPVEDDLNQSLLLIFRNEAKGYEAVVDQLSAQQLRVLTVLAVKGGASVLSKDFLTATGIAHASSVKAAFTRLEARGVIFRTNKEYRFVNPFFRRWLIYKNY
jgi:hypothetical protein